MFSKFGDYNNYYKLVKPRKEFKSVPSDEVKSKLRLKRKRK